MNVQMRIITDENVDQLLSMTYSDNINKLLQVDNKDLKDVTKDYVKDINDKVNNYNKKVVIRPPEESPVLPDEVVLDTETSSQEQNTNYHKSQEVEILNEQTGQFLHAFIHNVNFNSNGEENYDVLYDDGEIEEQVSVFRIKPYNEGQQYAPNSPQSNSPYSPQSNSPYAPNSPQYAPNSPQSNAPNSPPYSPNSPQYAPNSPPYSPNSPLFTPHSPDFPPPPEKIKVYTPHSPDFPPPNSSILEIEPPPPPPKEETKEEQTSSNSETKTINISENSSENSTSSNDSTKKITL
jgi:DNA-directed RNA polymerase II subunit RPB1